MKLRNLIIAGLLLITMIAEGAAPSRRAEMKAIYENNLKMQEQVKELEKQLVQMGFDIEIAEKAIENAKYVRSENDTYIETLKP